LGMTILLPARSPEFKLQKPIRNFRDYLRVLNG
jgi:hypothetical protein